MTQAQHALLDLPSRASGIDLTISPSLPDRAGLWDLAFRLPKRVIDVTLSIVILTLSSPILLLAALAIKLTSPGPILFRQARAGRGGRPFKIYKLRTMRDRAADEKELYRELNELSGAPVFKIRRDPRITPVGRLLRRSSIDELPQLMNVLRGEMSIVGPRPLPLDEMRSASWGEHLRLSVKPGLTCLWQIAGRTEIPYREWMQLDGYYVQNRSLSLDFKIMMKTIPAILSGRGAY
ncbi:MAG: sugar transferase [Phycisphaerae bacterium]|nr:sugar transferase [Phycisphaerae bacterium]